MKKIDFVYEVDKYEQFFFAHLSECDKRQYSGLLAMKLGYNGVSTVSEKLSINKHTVRKGKKELINGIVHPVGKIRQKGGGRKKNFSCQGFD